METNGIENTTCTTSDECRTMDKKGKFGGVKAAKGEAMYNEPQAQSRCIKHLNEITGRCVVPIISYPPYYTLYTP